MAIPKRCTGGVLPSDSDSSPALRFSFFLLRFIKASVILSNWSGISTVSYSVTLHAASGVSLTPLPHVSDKSHRQRSRDSSFVHQS